MTILRGTIAAIVSLPLVAGWLGSTPAQAQLVTTGGSFTPAANVLFATDFSRDPVGSFPSGLKFVRGPLDVVLVGGVPMLRAIGEGAIFQIPLGQPLPKDFTLEFDLIPKAGNGDDLNIEGGPLASRSVGSAEIRFNHQIASIMGGGQGMSQVTLPYDLQTELINQRSTVQMAMTGTQFKLFVNGRQIYNVPNLAFRRAAALRVFVGGRDDATNAVYIARISLATNTPGLVASSATGLSGTTTPAPTVTAVGNNRPATPAQIAAVTPPATGNLPGTITAVPPPPPKSPGTAVTNPPPLPPNAGRYRIVVTGFATSRGTVDDLTARDGRGDEVFATSAVVIWDRNTNQVAQRGLVWTPEYGDIGTGQRPTRIQAGSVSPQGGLWGGNGNDVVPLSYDPTGTSYPQPVVNRFPLLVWDGILTDGVEAVLVVPSLWEADGGPKGWDSYQGLWVASSPLTILASPVVQQQVQSSALSAGMIPVDPTAMLAGTLPTVFSGGLFGFFTVGAPATSHLDRPIGGFMSGGNEIYQERVVVGTREKLVSLAVGDGITLALPLAEPADGILNGLYTVYLRVERMQ